jgi:transposase-like protein
MLITIEIKRPHCHSPNITRNGKKSDNKQNYRCKHCGHQFISERTYRGTLSWIKNAINIMPVRGIGIRDISVVLQISITKALKVLKSGNYQIHPKKTIMIVLRQTSFGRMWGKRRAKCGLFTHITGKAGKSWRMCGGNGA